VFTAAHLDQMQEIIRDVCADFGARLAEFNGEPEHAHLPVNFPPTAAISRLVNSFKGVSSRRLRQAFPDLCRYRLGSVRLHHDLKAGALADIVVTSGPGRRA